MRQKIERSCAVCGKAFWIEPSRLRHGRGLHCSPACQYAAIRARRADRRVSCTCIGCGATFSLSPSRIASHKGAGKYCSRACCDTRVIGKEASEASTYEYQGVQYDRIQMLTIAEIIEGKREFHTPKANYRWVVIGRGIGDENGSAVMLPAGGYAWELAKSKGLIGRFPGDNKSPEGKNRSRAANPAADLFSSLDEDAA